MFVQRALASPRPTKTGTAGSIRRARQLRLQLVGNPLRNPPVGRQEQVHLEVAQGQVPPGRRPERATRVVLKGLTELFIAGELANQGVNGLLHDVLRAQTPIATPGPAANGQDLSSVKSTKTIS